MGEIAKAVTSCTPGSVTQAGLSEIVPQVGDRLRVRRMVERFEPDDAVREGAIVLLREAEEMQLRFRGADDQDLTVRIERLRHLAKEAMLVVGMVPDPQVLLIGVAMNVPARRVHERSLDPVGVDVEDARLFLVNPYDCVLHGNLLERARLALPTMGVHEPGQPRPPARGSIGTRGPASRKVAALSPRSAPGGTPSLAHSLRPVPRRQQALRAFPGSEPRHTAEEAPSVSRGPPARPMQALGGEEFPMHIVAAIVIGGIVGSLAKFFLPNTDPRGIVVRILLGITGGVAAGFVGAVVGWYRPGLTAPGIIASILGAMLVLFGYRMLSDRRRTT